MNKLIYSILTTISLLCLASCTSAVDEPTPPPFKTAETVTIHLDYSLFQSGVLSRAAEDAYDDYFTKCLENRTTTPTDYKLTFSSTDNAVLAVCKGKWCEQDMFCLPVATYNVTGTSYPQNEYGSTSPYLSFDVQVQIGKNDEVIIIPANYDCFLLLFKADNIKAVEGWVWPKSESYYSEKVDFTAINGYYPIYVHEKWIEDGKVKAYVNVIANDDSVNTVYLNNNIFKKGKYYYFNDVSTVIDLPHMENGNS